MSEEKAEQGPTQAEQNHAERMANARVKRNGRRIVLLSRDGDAFSVVADESEGIRTEADVKQYMEDNNVVGTLYGVRFSRYDKNGLRRGYTRYEQKVTKFE